MPEITDETIEELEGIANFLRGMCFDPIVPPRIKKSVMEKVSELDEITEKLLDTE